CLEQDHRPTLAPHVHRTAPMGPCVLISEDWYKILEFLVLFVISTAVTSIIEYTRRRRALRDALSPIREEILGKWHLELADFALSGQTYRDFSCKFWFDSTEAQKLRVFYFESNELEVDGNSPMVAFYVAEGMAGPEQIDLSFPLAAEIHLPGRPAFSILYWIRLNRFALRDSKKGIAFKEQWYSIANAGSEYQSAGPATLKFESKSRYSNPT
ncbi:hypothetical protein, partial [Methylobacterium sp. Leaf465]|uniref:hypothetical protein n=1 Tax=Methylobacterium sp. Leaf465 TaxID=1736385 RepID=UPI001AEBE04A